MTENQIKSPSKDVSLTPVFHTILAAENKTSELFVKSFQYQGENIATKHLGQIFGFFEIPDTQEDNAYIVNFLASVVKKEYFVNPKRSATDSFEAALHKINLALTELVKQGNTGWLGNLHGVVSVLENNAFHFSVTGDAAILLYRENQVTLISEGLADKDAALHPLKTFLEISSGALLPSDKILITSPELFTLCNPETLRKNAFRMDKNGFARYVRAALVNELPLGVSIIIDLDAAPAPVRPKKKAVVLREESREKLQNVFSSTPFVAATETSQPDPVSEIDTEEIVPPSEYTDKKTGHIYVQGETPSGNYTEPNAWQNFTHEYLFPTLATFGQFLKRLSKKSRKSMVRKVSILGTGGKELSQTLWNLSKEKGAQLARQSNQVIKARVQSLKERQIQKKNLATMEPEETLYEMSEEYAEEVSFSPNPLPLPSEEITHSTLNIQVEVPEELEITPSSKRQKALERFSPHYQRSKKIPERRSASENFQSLLSTVQKISPKQKILFGAFFGGALLLFLGILFFGSSEETVPAVTEDAVTSSESHTETSSSVSAPRLANATTRAEWTEGEAILSVTTDNNTIVVTPKSILNNGKVFPFVANGTIESATYMPDLRTIFLWSSANELVSWNIVDSKFTANTLPLPANTEVSALGTYLTYLYALDTTTGSIYRFARIDGGFSEPSSWLRTPLGKDTAKAFVVNDVIRIAGNTLDQYSRGTKEKTISENNYQVLGTSSNRTFTLGIETAQGKLTVWNTDGSQVYEGVHEELKGVTTVTYNENSQKLLVSQDQKLLEYDLSW